MVSAFIALGANLGNAAAALKQAVVALHNLPLTQVRVVSSFYQTAPIDTDSGAQSDQPDNDYLNAVAEIQTGLGALDLLDCLQQIEQAAGRERPYRNAPRLLDLDLLLYGTERIESERLTVPHPRMMQRAFVLIPLAEIAPGKVSAEQLHAVGHQYIELLGELGDVATRPARLSVLDPK